MSDLRSRNEFLQLVAEALNFGDQLTKYDREIRANLLLAYYLAQDHTMTNESDPRWAGSIGNLPLPPTATHFHTSVRAGTNDHTSVRVWLSDFE